jgi:hypothetical protein
VENWDQYGIVYALARALRERRSWAGETHIQKTGYFLQHLLTVPLGCRFILYKHGPFSFDLRQALAAMEALDLIKWEPKPIPYGPSFTPGPLSSFIGALTRVPETYRTQIHYITERLAEKRVVELERLGTALYVTLEGGVPQENRPVEMVRLKPHIELQDARAAVQEVDAIIAEVKDRNLAAPSRAATAA